MTQSINNSRMEDTLRAEAVRCAIYARYSSDLQRPASIEDQNRNCRELIEEKRWILIEEFVWADSAKSGITLIGRDGLDSLLEHAKKKPRPFDCVVIDDTSRLGRNLGDVLKITEIFEHYGVFLYFVSQRFDSRDPNFRQLLILYGMVDEQYVAGLRKKVHRGQKGRVLSGFVPGGRCYGYKNVQALDPSRKERGRLAVLGVRLEIDEEQAAVVREIFEMYASGYSLSQITKSLNRKQVAPPVSARQSVGWSYLTIRDMLRRDKYRGIHNWNRTQDLRNPLTGRREQRRKPAEEVVTLAVPEWRIVTDELWDKVHKRIQLMSRYGTPRLGGLNRTEQSRTYLFSGLLKCGLCSRRLIIVGKHSGIPVYGCPSHRYNGVCANAVVIRQDRLEHQLLGRIVGRLLRAENIETAISTFQEQLRKRMLEGEDRRNSRSGRVREERVDLEKQATNLVQAIKATGGSDLLLSEFKKVEARLTAIKQERESNSGNSVDLSAVSPQQIREFILQKALNMEGLLKGEPLIARQTLRQHVDHLILTPKEVLGERVLEVTGTVELFIDEQSVVHSVSRRGNTMHYTFPLTLTGFHLNPSAPVQNTPDELSGSQGIGCTGVPGAPTTAELRI
jgi:site-specific DNA recombinase